MQDAYRIYDNNSFLRTVGRYFTNISFRVRLQMRFIQYFEIMKTKQGGGNALAINSL